MNKTKNIYRFLVIYKLLSTGLNCYKPVLFYQSEMQRNKTYHIAKIQTHNKLSLSPSMCETTKTKHIHSSQQVLKLAFLFHGTVILEFPHQYSYK